MNLVARTGDTSSFKHPHSTEDITDAPEEEEEARNEEVEDSEEDKGGDDGTTSFFSPKI